MRDAVHHSVDEPEELGEPEELDEFEELGESEEIGETGESRRAGASARPTRPLRPDDVDRYHGRPGRESRVGRATAPAARGLAVPHGDEPIDRRSSSAWAAS